MSKDKLPSIRISKLTRKLEKLIASAGKDVLLDAVVAPDEVPEGTLLITARVRLPYQVDADLVLLAVSRLRA